MVTIGSSQWWSNFLTFLLLSITLGWLGIDRFYKGEVAWGIVKLITIGGLGVWYLVDICIHAYRFGTTGQWTKGELT